MPFLLTSGENRAAVYLAGTTVADMDDMSIFEQPYEVVAEFFHKRSRGETGLLNEIKVVFLGDGEAGKSHTIARLMSDGGEPEDYTDQSTPGIVIKHKEYTRNGRTFRVNYWDFGGQEIMHSMHRIFLTGRTMYVVLLNARDDTQGERAKYWLHNIKSFAPDAPVLLVLNKIDQNPKASVDEKDLRGRYQKLTGVVPLSARDFSRERFMEEFTDVLLQEIEKTGYLNAQWPNNWAAVKGRLENMQTHYIMGSDYREICRACQVDKNQKELLHWFNDLGVSFCCDGEDDYTLEDYVILRPDWITNALYILLFNPLENAENGLIPHKSIYQLLRNAHDNDAVRCTLPEARYDAGDIGYVLGIMRKFGLSFTDGHGNEFIPMLCQQESTVDVQSLHNDEETLEFNMEFDYLPNNLLHRMMVERSGELDLENVWRTGTRFRYPELGYSAVVVSDSRVLRFFIRSQDPMHRPNTYLTMLKAHVDRIVEDMGIAKPVCKLIYKLDGKRDEFDYEDLKLDLELGDTTKTSRAHKRKILIEDILNQSAPDGVEDEKLLLDTIVSSCLHIQQEPDYYLKDGETGRGMEDKRNRRVRDDLELRGFKVKDQTQRGLSGSGRGVGELDLLICSGEKMAMPWTIIEALRVSGGAKTEWEAHLNKLLENYNYFGAPCVYLLTYVDDDGTRFPKIWDSYLERIPKVHPGKFKFVPGSLREVKDANRGNSIKVAKCRYEKGGEMTNAYHIFVQIPKRKK
jgi:small GTP-binding protein